MKKKKKIIKKILKEKDGAYTATIKVLGKIHTSTGKTVQEAIESFKIGKAMGLSILTIQKGDKKQEKILPPTITVRLFSQSRIMHEVALKQVLMRFSL